MQVQDKKVEILLLDASTAYLGRSLSLGEMNDVELEHRRDVAWKRFFAHKLQICNKSLPLKSRLKLFSAVVTPTVLYGCESWAMTRGREHQLRTAQRRMLRWIVGVGRNQRQDDESNSEERLDLEEPEVEEGEEEVLESTAEPFVDRIKGATAIAEGLLHKTNLSDWVDEARRRQWNWAGRVAQLSDHRWSQLVMFWKLAGGKRDQGRPVKRWSDDIAAFCKGRLNDDEWYTYAQNKSDWKLMQDDYVH